MTEDKHAIALKHNLSFAIKKAMIDHNPELLKVTAQKVVDAGYDLEDMKLTPEFMKAVMTALVRLNWRPKLKGMV